MYLTRRVERQKNRVCKLESRGGWDTMQIDWNRMKCSVKEIIWCAIPNAHHMGHLLWSQAILWTQKFMSSHLQSNDIVVYSLRFALSCSDSNSFIWCLEVYFRRSQSLASGWIECFHRCLPFCQGFSREARLPHADLDCRQSSVYCIRWFGQCHPLLECTTCVMDVGCWMLCLAYCKCFCVPEGLLSLHWPTLLTTLLTLAIRLSACQRD